MLLNTLRKYDVRVTFFVVGVNLDNCALLKQILADGHIIGSHTFSHTHLRAISHGDMVQQILKTEMRLKNCTGHRPWLFRPPYGEINKDTTNFLHQRNYHIVSWNFDTFDWRTHKVVESAQKLLKKHERGGIMLMHEYTWTTDAQKTLIPLIRDIGWKIVEPIQILSYPDQQKLKHDACTHQGSLEAAAPAQPLRWCEQILEPPAGPHVETPAPPVKTPAPHEHVTLTAVLPAPPALTAERPAVFFTAEHLYICFLLLFLIFSLCAKYSTIRFLFKKKIKDRISVALGHRVTNHHQK